MNINRNTVIKGDILSKAVEYALGHLRRDMEKACAVSTIPETEICLVSEKMEEETFCLAISRNRLELRAFDALGFVYGIYEISRRFLGIADFWFWNDQVIKKRECYEIADGFEYRKKPFRVRYRGWFVNDEVLLHDWSVDQRKDKPWEMVFETLLRCSGNMVIPGTDRNGVLYRKLASDMGLYITHHHAEPLGAEMFARAHPRLNASYEEHGEKFRELWKRGILEQKGMRVIWNLGFRGQGDCPFWENDPQYRTPKARGELMGRLIRVQYDMVKEEEPDAVCCTNLYGETMELYRDGFLVLPGDVIKIWADNGFGKMVTRRQENHNPRVPALPKPGNDQKNGIYYHASFYDLQAANHMTMLPNTPEFVKQELVGALECGCGDFWIVNCSNVKPHVYFLDLIAKMWRDGYADTEEHRKAYVKRYFGPENEDIVTKCLQDYHRYAVAYGGHEDEHAGEQFSNHPARILVSQYMKDRTKRAEAFLWAGDRENLREQILWYDGICESAAKGYGEYLRECQAVSAVLGKHGKRIFDDSLLLQAEIHAHCFAGAHNMCRSLQLGFEEDYRKAFYEAGRAREEYLAANQAMRAREHGKWQNFYRNECLTDIKQTAWVLEGLMSYLRNLGEGPHFYHWMRDFLYSEEDRRVTLVLNMENHPDDLKLFEAMKAKWEDR